MKHPRSVQEKDERTRSVDFVVEYGPNFDYSFEGGHPSFKEAHEFGEIQKFTKWRVVRRTTIKQHTVKCRVVTR